MRLRLFCRVNIANIFLKCQLKILLSVMIRDVEFLVQILKNISNILNIFRPASAVLQLFAVNIRIENDKLHLIPTMLLLPLQRRRFLQRKDML